MNKQNEWELDHQSPRLWFWREVSCPSDLGLGLVEEARCLCCLTLAPIHSLCSVLDPQGQTAACITQLTCSLASRWISCWEYHQQIRRWEERGWVTVSLACFASDRGCVRGTACVGRSPTFPAPALARPQSQQAQRWYGSLLCQLLASSALSWSSSHPPL